MSNLPSWYSAAVRKHLERQGALQSTMQPLEVKVGQDFGTAPGWRELGVEYTCVPDSQYPWDPAVLKAIWSFDPGVIPLWVRHAFLSPKSEGVEKEVVFGRHGIGRHVSTPHSELPVLPVSMPTMPCQGVTFQRPTLIELVITGKPDSRAADLPGAYEPFGWGLYHFLRSRYGVRSTAEVVKLAIHDPREAEERRLAKVREEALYKQRDIERFVERKLAEISEVEMRDRLLGSRSKVKNLFLDMAKGGLPTLSGAK